MAQSMPLIELTDLSHSLHAPHSLGDDLHRCKPAAPKWQYDAAKGMVPPFLLTGTVDSLRHASVPDLTPKTQFVRAAANHSDEPS